MERKSFYQIFWGNFLPFVLGALAASALCLFASAFTWLVSLATDNRLAQVALVVTGLVAIAAVVKSFIDWRAQEEALEAELRRRMNTSSDDEL